MKIIEEEEHPTDANIILLLSYFEGHLEFHGASLSNARDHMCGKDKKNNKYKVGVVVDGPSGTAPKTIARLALYRNGADQKKKLGFPRRDSQGQLCRKGMMDSNEESKWSECTNKDIEKNAESSCLEPCEITVTGNNSAAQGNGVNCTDRASREYCTRHKPICSSHSVSVLCQGTCGACKPCKDTDKYCEKKLKANDVKYLCEESSKYRYRCLATCGLCTTP